MNEIDHKSTYALRKEALIRELQTVQAGEGIRLSKNTSNLFRDYKVQAKRTLNVRDFNHVLQVNAEEGWIEVEGMTPYYDLVQAALAQNVMPTVVPQLRSITIGGAVSGVGIEATSFRHGLVHETIQEMEVVLGSGEVVTATPTNEHRDLFFGIPNSYGSLGYILKVKVKAIPVKRYVHVQHKRFYSYNALVEGIRMYEQDATIDFLDGVIFSPDEMYLSVGRFVDEAPYTNNYTYKKIYYTSIKARSEDYLTTHDYIWRWDTDWFWCSKALYMENPIIRRILGRKRLNSVTYMKIMRWNQKWKCTKRIEKLLGKQSEAVIQDVAIPIQALDDFLQFYETEIGIRPIWVCPFRTLYGQNDFTLFPLDPRTTYVDVGFWGSKQVPVGTADGAFNRKLENKVDELQGIKSLYSSVYYDEDRFWSIYNGVQYKQLKQKYDPTNKRPNLYQVVTARNN